MASWKRYLNWGASESDVEVDKVREANVQIQEQVFVDGVPVYQEGSGAPIEVASPLGYHVGWFGILFLNVSQMVGTGVFSTREYMLSKLCAERC
jgi:hypothetical protein